MKPSSSDPQENLIKRDRVTNPHERHEEARSRVTTGSRMTRKPSQTENLKASAGNLYLLLKSWDIGIDLEAVHTLTETERQRQGDRETGRNNEREKKVRK